jgi:hypothetical protein
MAKFTKYTGESSGKTFYTLTMGPKEAAEFATFVHSTPWPEGNNIQNVLNTVQDAVYDGVVPTNQYTPAKVA